MLNTKRVVALIPLRGGSKSIPKKNIRNIAGKPLCSYVIKTAVQIKDIDEVIVSTDSEEIMAIVRQIDSKVRILKRPPELATDTSSTEETMLHLAKNVKFDILITIQATSPLITAQDLRNGLSKFKEENLDSLVTGVRISRFFWKETGEPVNYDYVHRPRRQDFKGWIMENGAFYITSRQILEQNKCRLGGKIGILEMSPETGIEIDEPKDWALVEFFLKKQKTQSIPSDLSKIRLLMVDVDGTLTDGGMYYTSQGESLKKFNTRDAKGLELIKSQGIEVIIITSEDSDIVRSRAKKLRISDVFCGVTSKIDIMEMLAKQKNVSFHEMAFIGDDLNDIECMKAVGFSACPADAVTAIKDQALYICEKKGGDGAVREVCDLILEL